jgi:hypothetical protein
MDAALRLGETAFREKLSVAEATRLLAVAQNNGWSELLRRVTPEILKYYPGDAALSRYITTAATARKETK